MGTDGKANASVADDEIATFGGTGRGVIVAVRLHPDQEAAIGQRVQAHAFS